MSKKNSKEDFLDFSDALDMGASIIDNDYLFSKNDFDKSTVYVRELSEDDPIFVQLEPHLDDKPETLFAVMTQQGEPVAVVSDRNVAFAGARRNKFKPVSVH